MKSRNPGRKSSALGRESRRATPSWAKGDVRGSDLAYWIAITAIGLLLVLGAGLDGRLLG